MEAIVAAVWPEWLRHGGEAVAGARRLESGETVLDGTAFPSAFALFMMQVSVIIALSRIIGFVLKPVSLGNTRALGRVFRGLADPISPVQSRHVHGTARC